MSEIMTNALLSTWPPLLVTSMSLNIWWRKRGASYNETDTGAYLFMTQKGVHQIVGKRHNKVEPMVVSLLAYVLRYLGVNFPPLKAAQNP